MALDLFSFGLGFTGGVSIAGVGWMLAQRAQVQNPESTVLARTWALDEVSRTGPPALMVERVTGVAVPAGAKVLVPNADAVSERVRKTCEVRVHPDVTQNCALARDVALVFSSHVHARANGVYTRDLSTVKKLQAEFTRLWAAAEPVFDRVTVDAVASRVDRHVEFVGTATEMMEYRGKRMLRVADQGHVIGIVTDDPEVAIWQGRIVRVTGRVVKEGSNVFVEASKIERVSPRAVAAAARGEGQTTAPTNPVAL